MCGHFFNLVSYLWPYWVIFFSLLLESNHRLMNNGIIWWAFGNAFFQHCLWTSIHTPLFTFLVSVSSNSLYKRQVHLLFYAACRTSYFRKFWASPELCISCLDLLCNYFVWLQLQHLLVLGETSQVAAADVIFSRPAFGLTFLAPKWTFSSVVWSPTTFLLRRKLPQEQEDIY